MEPGTWDGRISGGWGIAQDGEILLVVFGRDESGRGRKLLYKLLTC